MSIQPSDGGQLLPLETAYPVPWTVGDTWLGLLLMVVLIAGMVVLSVFLPPQGPARSVTLVVLEPLLVIPVAIVLGRKRISWKHLGFRSFPWAGMALGCGALLLIYPLIVLHNFLLVKLGIQTQGDSIAELYQTLGAPIPILVAGILLAPLAEEIFFRGFLFPGLRQRYGWIKAMLLSSAIFAGFHLQPVALIPTFVLGCVLAYAYQRSNSIWPGIILHFLVNGLALCVTAAAVQFGWF